MHSLKHVRAAMGKRNRPAFNRLLPTLAALIFSSVPSLSAQASYVTCWNGTKTCNTAAIPIEFGAGLKMGASCPSGVNGRVAVRNAKSNTLYYGIFKFKGSNTTFDRRGTNELEGKVYGNVWCESGQASMYLGFCHQRADSPACVY